MISLRTAFTMAVFAAAAASQAQDDNNWVRIQLDERFRSEGVVAVDIDKDGTADVVAGDVWYKAPGANSSDYLNPSAWKRSEIRMPGEFVAGVGYSNSFANFAFDMDNDGWQDVVIVGFPGDPFHWYRNPGADQSSHWQEHQIWTSICNESPEFEDLDADGKPEFVFGSQPEAQMGFSAIPSAAKAAESFGFHPIGEKGDPHQNGTFKYYHGLGAGDMNGDGHRDIIICHGWWESPGDLQSTALWKFHPVRIATPEGPKPLPSASYIYSDDFDLDGDADLFLSSAHTFGVWWAENKGTDTWELHEIDKSFSQTHAVERVDINGDGQLDYVTGKRFFAHNGNDPGGHDPVVMYWYETLRTKGQAPVFKAHRIVAGEGTGVGTQFQIHDMNGDGKPDIVLSNKKGVNVLVQK
ncbi:MAG: VCBS repeat-containing protein [Planctomycetaceae bacterium]|nr:VCBS repeat-containing protein [Planctomycetaceae bacterium]